MDIIKYYNDKSIYYIKDSIKSYINNLEKPNSLKYLYIYGENGIGKTTIVKNILSSMNYNINYLDCNHNKLTLDELMVYNVVEASPPKANNLIFKFSKEDK